ncbi:hypothetical protein CS078_14040 [Pseudomonas prosekii]|uniref:Uncharacterized protein n=1 Tax=Pseudomonas prosekii TaxID=1148509 RepID=A0A3L8CMX6_9PSED|nr:hypothetical protein CS076_20850 [Pseudomonas prosekii]RLU09263.1 hypothetical protein CS078_14040 [Pseudomonas prosekii]
MDGQRAVFERGILAQRPLLIRPRARSKGYMDIPLGWAVIPVGARLAREERLRDASGRPRYRSSRASLAPTGDHDLRSGSGNR